MDHLVKSTALIKLWLQKTASTIKHDSVIKDIAQETDISPGYFLMLTLANLIALSGLITNSSPVIIGAMLISPLMGPILSFGFAFITGDKSIWNRAVKKIAVSVAMTLVVAAIASFLSPMQEITQEILSRTRPSLYDLIVAFLAGTAGAAALCTKKNYLTIVPGVAIATAVIPPLSVSGFGIGIWSFGIFFGGFFLFFTNFVAITIATCAVFFIYGFRPKMISEMDLAHLKKRFSFLGAVLLIISIPLIYTLHVSVSEVQLRSGIHAVLQKEFDREKRSHLMAFDFAKTKDGKITINVVINAVDYLNDEEIARAEKIVATSIKRDVTLSVEQVKVQPGGLKPQAVQALAPVIAPPRAAVDILKSSRESIIAVMRQSNDKMERIISPSTITDFSVGFHDKTFLVSIALKIKRDTPVSEEERLWLGRWFASELNLPVDLTVETVPFFPLLTFRRGETALGEEMKAVLGTMRDVYGKDPGLRCRVESYPESGIASPKARALARKRAEAVEQYLVTVCKLSTEQIERVVLRKSARDPFIKVSVFPEIKNMKKPS